MPNARRRTQNATQPIKVTVQQPPKPKQKSKPKPKQPVKPHASKRDVQAMCGLIDPFCLSARGAKWPDQSSTPTFSHQGRGIVGLPVNASGNGGILFVPGYSYGYKIDSTVTSPGTLVYASPFSILTGPVSGVNCYRINTWGIKIRSRAAPLNASGVVRIRTFNFSDASALGTVSGTGLTAVSTMDVPLKDLKEVVVWSKPYANNARQYFRDYDGTFPKWTTTADNSVSPWSSIQVYMDGGPTGTPLEIEYVYNWEVQFQDGESLALFATRSPPADPQAQSMVDQIVDAMGSMFERNQQQIENGVIGYVTSYFNQQGYGAPIGNRRRLRG